MASFGKRHASRVSRVSEVPPYRLVAVDTAAIRPAHPVTGFHSSKATRKMPIIMKAITTLATSPTMMPSQVATPTRIARW